MALHTITLFLVALVAIPTIAVAQWEANGGYTHLYSSTVLAAKASSPLEIFPTETLLSFDDQSSGQTTTGSSGKQKTSTNEPPWDWADGVSVGLGYQYTNGNPGIGGLNLGAGWRWKSQFELATDMDFGSQTTILGGTNSKSTRQVYLFGGRYYLNKFFKQHHSRFDPFGHLMYGWSHQSVKTTQGIPITQTVEESATDWAWDFGGGVDYLLSKHWALRGRADWVKTHFSNASQSHFKWVAGFWYSFSSRELPK